MNVPPFVHGCIAPVFTAFHEDKSLDDQGQRNLLDFLHQTGAITTFFVRSGMGQMFTFSVDDVKHLAQVACDHLEGRAPVIVGCNGQWDRDRGRRPDPEVFTRQAVELSQFAESIGAAGVVHTMPEAIPLRDGETGADAALRYFERIAASVSLPVFMYQPPGIDPLYTLSPALLAQLADIPNILGVKVSNADAGYTFDLIHALKGKDCAFISGAETAWYAHLYAGSPAIIGQGSCLNPALLKLEQSRFHKGDHRGVLEAQDAVNRLCNGCRHPVDFLKQYATEHGYPVGRTARELTTNMYNAQPVPLSPDEYTAFKQLLESELDRFGLGYVIA